MRARIAIPILIAVAIAVLARETQRQTLVGFASLPAESFAAGPTSGQFITPANGIAPPFVNRQPVQGFSSVARASDGDFLVMPDNGFGNKPTSPDFVLRVYRISPDFKTKTGGTGSVLVRSHIDLSDPDRRILFPIIADADFYPGPPKGIAVDATIKSQRLLTGADFDIESMREAPDGTLWFGDEFGPFLLHTDAGGKVLDSPIPLPGVQSPQNPLGGVPNLGASKGFEGLGMTPNGKLLYPMLEGPVTGDDVRNLRINEFDADHRRYTDRRWVYRLEEPGHAIGDLTAVTDRLFLIVERDNVQGEAARFKKIFLIDLDQRDPAGLLVKHRVADLLNLADPSHLGGPLPTFRFPFQTIESVIALSDTELGVLNDNNYPFSAGREPGRADPNEFIVVRLDRPLSQYSTGKQ
ncbi:MAG TPA: esterase-like activity of phytase family protein [Vicinamibacterales bacterium]|nr:esterase-like activity of phytase family protein [Vicinamibacterales bacterium]